MQLVRDPKVGFPAYYVKARAKTEQRAFVAQHALLWLKFQHERGAAGCVVFDIDDTLIDGNEAVVHGFELMVQLFTTVGQWFPVHVVTARPDDRHAEVMRLLQRRGLHVPPDRLHMLPARLYDSPTRHVEEFKWGVHERLVRAHGAVIARFGDKLWDVAHYESLRTYLGHVADRDAYVFFDPALRGTLSGKLPGAD